MTNEITEYIQIDTCTCGTNCAKNPCYTSRERKKRYKDNRKKEIIELKSGTIAIETL